MHPTSRLRPFGAAALLAGALFLAAPASAQSHDAFARSQMAKVAPPLLAEVGRVQDGFAPGLDARQGRTLQLALAHTHASSARVVQLPRELATSTAFVLGYSRYEGLVAEASPRGGGRILAVRDELVDLSEGSYGWVGRLFVADDPEVALGTILLVSREGVGVSGEIQVRANAFAIEPLGDGLHVLADVDEGALPDGGDDPTMDGAGPAGAPAEAALADAVAAPLADLAAEASIPAVTGVAAVPGAVTTQRVMVLYTAGAQSSVSNINSVIDQAILNSNTAYSRSQTAPRLQLAHRQLLTGFSESGDITLDTDTRLPSNATVRSLRDTHRADLVVLLTSPGAYGSAAGKAVGIYTPGVSTAETAYAIADVSASVSNKTFTHEVGHLQGAQHHPDDPTGATVGYSYGRGQRQKWAKCFLGGWICGYNRFATIMAYTEGGEYPRIQNLSNPDVEYDGKDTGTSSRDNARALDNSAATVSAYRANPVAVSISGPTFIFAGNPASFSASVSGGAGATSYRWFRDGSFTGVTSSSYSTTGTSSFSVRVDVTRGSETASATRFVTVQDVGGCEPYLIPIPEPCPIYLDAPQAASPDAASVEAAPEAFALSPMSPNPVRGSAVVTFEAPEAATVSVAVFDVLGREVAVLADGPVGAGVHRARFDASALTPGTYVLRMRAGAFTAAQEVTVVR